MVVLKLSELVGESVVIVDDIGNKGDQYVIKNVEIKVDPFKSDYIDYNGLHHGKNKPCIVEKEAPIQILTIEAEQFIKADSKRY